MSGRHNGRRGNREAPSNDLELDLLNRALDALRRAKDLNDESTRLGVEIVQLEEELLKSTTGKSEMLRRLDELYRQKLRKAEDEKKIHDEEDVANNLAILATMRSTDEPPVPGTRGPKTGRGKTAAAASVGTPNKAADKPRIESDVTVESPDLSAGESHHSGTTGGGGGTRVEMLKRKGQTQQRAASVASARGGTNTGSGTPVASSRERDRETRDTRDTDSKSANASTNTTTTTVTPTTTSTTTTNTNLATTSSTTTTDPLLSTDQLTHRGLAAERAGQLTPGAHVFYKFRSTTPTDLGVGIQCIIKKVHTDRKPTGYDVQDPEPDGDGKQNVHKATARDLYPIPPEGSMGRDDKGVRFESGVTVFARYPDTDTFYKAKVVRGLKAGYYTLRFEGEEDNVEQAVERRFVIDTRMR